MNKDVYIIETCSGFGVRSICSKVRLHELSDTTTLFFNIGSSIANAWVTFNAVDPKSIESNRIDAFYAAAHHWQTARKEVYGRDRSWRWPTASRALDVHQTVVCAATQVGTDAAEGHQRRQFSVAQQQKQQQQQNNASCRYQWHSAAVIARRTSPPPPCNYCRRRHW